MGNEIIVQLSGVSKVFRVGRGKYIKAVDNVSMVIEKGQTVGLVGESGCGKTTLGNLLVRMFAPTSGAIEFWGRDIREYRGNSSLDFCRRVQMIFQDPYASLDPRMTVEAVIAEGLKIHKICQGRESTERVHRLLEMVGLEKEFGNRFPHEFSGGQRQRIGIARALAVEPEFIVCDEPVSALDVSIQAQTINLLKRLQRDLGLTYLFIAHDLNMVRYISDRVLVMYLGSVVEASPSSDIYEDPLHPYTRALLNAIPVADPVIERNKPRFVLQGDVPSPINMGPGCPFYSRCQSVGEVCANMKPPVSEVKPGHFAACHLYA